MSLAILGIATLSVFHPLAIFAILGGILFTTLTFRSPVFGISVAILASILGEFGRVEFSGISFLILDLIAPAILGIWFFKKLIHQEKIILDWISGSLLIFWGIGILSLLFGSFDLSNEELKFALLHFFRFVGISGLLLVARDLGKKDTSRTFYILMLAGVLFAISGFILLKLIPDFTEAGLADLGWDPHVRRLTGTFFDPNFAGGAFAFLIALLGGKFLSEKKFPKQSLILVICGILGTALLLTFSRSGLLALGISGLILGIFGDRRILLAMLVVGILGISTSPRLAERVDEFSKSVNSIGEESQQVLDPTAQLRIDSWRDGWSIWQKNPILGTGFGTYKFHQTFSSEESHAATGSDASLLNIGATTGILGFGIFVIFLWNLTIIAFQKRKWGFLAAFAGLLVHSIFVNSLFFPPLALYFFVSAGIATRYHK